MVSIELDPHQEKAIDELSTGKILCGGTGVGKSRTAMVYYWQQEAPKDVYVITTAKKRDSLDWEGEAALLGIGKESDATLEGVLTVDSWNNIWKYEFVHGGFFIFDEQRLVGSGAWTKSFYKIAKQNHWILLSATPGDTWLDYIPVFVANGFYKNRTEFKREHVVFSSWSKFPKVERYIGVGRLVRLRNKILVKMPYERHTVRVFHDVPVDYDAKLFDKAVKTRWDPFLDEPMRDVGQLYRVMRKIANSHPSRTETVLTLLKEHPRLIVFYNFDYELEMLKIALSEEQERQYTLSCTKSLDIFLPSEKRSKESKSTTNLMIAEWNGHKHEQIPNSESWVYLVQYMAGSEGWNCIQTDSIVFFSLTYSYRNFAQAQGRIDRMNTPFSVLNYYILKSNSWIDKSIWKALKLKKNFNEKEL